MGLIRRAALVCIFCWPMAGFAQEHGPATEHHASGHATNEIALSVGITHEHRDNAIALGVEYERRINSNFGIGSGAEQTFGDLDFWVYTVPFTFHADKWKFVVAPGIEESHGHTEELARLALGYEFETPGLNIVPTFSVDFVDSETFYIVGISLAKGF